MDLKYKIEHWTEAKMDQKYRIWHWTEAKMDQKYKIEQELKWIKAILCPLPFPESFSSCIVSPENLISVHTLVSVRPSSQEPISGHDDNA